MEKADHHAVHALCPDGGRDLAQPFLVQGPVHRPVRQPPLRYLEAQRPLYERLRMVEMDVVHPGPGLPANLQQIAEAFRGHERDPAAAALDERVGSDRGAVGETAHPRGIEAVFGQHLADAVDDRPVGAIGRRW